MTAAPLDPSLEPLAFLLGTWRGEGRGEFPTIEPFAFEEETRFWHEGGGFLAYSLRTWSPRTGAHLHSETGFWRPQPDGRLDVTLAHPLGLTEVAEGTIAAGEIHLRSRSVERTSAGASPTTALERRYLVDGDRIDYEVLMATDSVPLVRHIVGKLHRR